MGRIRTVKPELLTHEELFSLERETGLPMRIAFVGLFTICDREGRFKWEPNRIKLAVLPYDELDFSRVLDALMTRGFVVKYSVDAKEFGIIPTFKKHQVINNREGDSVLPSPDCGEVMTREPRVKHAQNDDGEFLSTKEGYVYLALCRASLAFKIGFAANDPEQRVKDLSTGSPNDLELVEFISAEKAMETTIHRALKPFHMRGEWFHANEHSASAIDAWFTRAGRVVHAALGEGKGREGKGRGKEEEGDKPIVQAKAVPGEVEAVFTYWQQKRNYPRAKLDTKRLKSITARLKDGYSVDDLCRAVDGIARSPHHMGENDRRTVYDDIELICRDGPKLDGFLKLANAGNGLTPKLQNQIDSLQKWMEEQA